MQETTLGMAATLAVALLSLWILLVLPCTAETVIQDPMEAQANSFGWLAIRNFTYCLSDRPDPPDKPRGIQPSNKSPGDLGSGQERLTGIGDSVVVLYHPDNTNQAISWCNTLVAFQSTKHVQCHKALPTCQRCDAVRDTNAKKSGTNVVGASNPEAVEAGASVEGSGRKAPSKRLGGGLHQAKAKKQSEQLQQVQPQDGLVKQSEQPVPPSDLNSGLVPLQKRDETAQDPNDPWVSLSDTEAGGKSQSQPQPQPVPQFQPGSQPKDTVPRPFGISSTLSSSTSNDDDASALDPSEDPELEAAISEFQDYCENKLTLAVRADCPLHLVKEWLDEPPFDLHRFCMSLRGADGYTLHDNPSRHRARVEAPSEVDMGKQGGQRFPNNPAAVGNARQYYGGGLGNAVGGGVGELSGVVDPNDPVIPYPSDNFGAPPSAPLPRLQPQQ